MIQRATLRWPDRVFAMTAFRFILWIAVAVFTHAQDVGHVGGPGSGAGAAGAGETGTQQQRQAETDRQAHGKVHNKGCSHATGARGCRHRTLVPRCRRGILARVGAPRRRKVAPP